MGYNNRELKLAIIVMQQNLNLRKIVCMNVTRKFIVHARLKICTSLNYENSALMPSNSNGHACEMNPYKRFLSFS